MKKLLKGLSVLEIVIGVLSLVVGIAALTVGGIMGAAAELPIEQQATISMKVSAVLCLISGVFNLACGICGLKGAKGDEKKLATAVVLGWIGLVSAVISGALTLIGDASIARICSTIFGSVSPILVLVSAASVKKESKDSMEG